MKTSKPTDRPSPNFKNAEAYGAPAVQPNQISSDQNSTSQLSTIGFILGCTAVICAILIIFWCIAIICLITGIVFSVLGIKTDKENQRQPKLASAGLILNILAIVVLVIWVAIAVIFLSNLSEEFENEDANQEEVSILHLKPSVITPN